MSVVTETKAFQIAEALVEMAKELGAEYPAFTETSDGSIVILDTYSGRTWRVKLEEF